MKKGISYYKKKLDTIYSQYIRQKDADKDGMNYCYTCGVKKHYKELQCGHFAPRQYLSLRYEEKNTKPQCYACNMLYNGQPSAFAVKLKAEYGESIVGDIEGRRKEITRYFPYELKIEEYKEKLKNLSTTTLEK